MSLTLFKSPAAEGQYLAAYDAVMELWPAPYESRRLPTRYGVTHLIACGPEDRPPLVLLHGFGVNATMWIPFLECLGQSNRVYALDTIGDLGKSVPSRPLEKITDFVDWLQDVLDGLGLERANLVGFSQGAWIALNYAVHCPEALAKLILISPNAGLTPVSPRFMMRLMAMAVFPTARAVESWARWNSTAWDTQIRYYRLVSQLMKAGLAGQNWGRSGMMPVTFRDEELRKIGCPVLMMAGEQEVVNNPVQAMDRARLHIPTFEGAVIEQARHMLPFDQPQRVCERIAAFLGDPV